MKAIFFIFFILSGVFLGCSKSDSQADTGVIDGVEETSVKMTPLNIRSNVTEYVPYAINLRVALFISAPLDMHTVNENTVYIIDKEGRNVGVALEPSNDGSTGKILLTPHVFFQPSSSYTLVVTTDLKDVYGRSLREEYRYEFTTANDPVDNSELRLRATKPKSGMAVEPHTDISVEFSSALSNEALYTGEELIQVTSNGMKIEGTLDFFNSMVTFVPNEPLPYDATVEVSIVGFVKDLFGNTYEGDVTSWSFITKQETSSLEINKGFTSYYQLPTHEHSRMVRLVQTLEGEDMLMIVRENAADFYGIDMSNAASPSIVKRYRIAFESALTSVHYSKEKKGVIYFGTFANGVDIVNFDSNSSEVMYRLPYAKPIYGINAGRTSKSWSNYLEPDRLYVTGPDIGMDVYALAEGKEPVFLNNATDPNALYLRSVDVHYSETAETRVYVTNYNHGVHVYDENGSKKIGATDLKIAARDVSIMYDSNTQEEKPILFSPMGNMYELNQDGSFGSKYSEMLWRYKEYSTDDKNNFFFVGGGRLLLFNIEGGYEGVIASQGWITSAAYGLADTSYGQVEFIVTLDEDGMIRVWNRYAQNK